MSTVARSKSSTSILPPDLPKAALSAAAVVLVVGTLVLAAYVLLLIVWVGFVGDVLEALTNVNGDLEPWPMVLLALLAGVMAWGVGLGLAWLFGRATGRHHVTLGGFAGLVGLVAGLGVLRLVNLL